jgi:hypothetical protein
MHLEQHQGHFLSVPQGTRWELSRNALRTLWGICWEFIGKRRDAFECFLHFTFIHYKIVYILYYTLYK